MNPYRHFYLYLSETYQLSEYSMDFHEVRTSMHGAYPANGLQKSVCNWHLSYSFRQRRFIKIPSNASGSALCGTWSAKKLYLNALVCQNQSLSHPTVHHTYLRSLCMIEKGAAVKPWCRCRCIVVAESWSNGSMAHWKHCACLAYGVMAPWQWYIGGF